MPEINITAKAMAEGLQALMIYANFSGLINQPEGGPFLQYSVEKIAGTEDRAIFCVEMGSNSFTINVSAETKTEVPDEKK